MGEGLTRVAEACGGMRVSARGETCDYVLRGRPQDDAAEIRDREARGWRYVGPTPDEKFMRFVTSTTNADSEGT